VRIYVYVMEKKDPPTNRGGSSLQGPLLFSKEEGSPIQGRKPQCGEEKPRRSCWEDPPMRRSPDTRSQVIPITIFSNRNNSNYNNYNVRIVRTVRTVRMLGLLGRLGRLFRLGFAWGGSSLREKPGSKNDKW
jgi:hypothetical protein